jgi:serine/threonine protein kinase
MQHPNIIHMVGACTDPLCLVTEYCQLGSLSDIIRINPGRLTWPRVKSLMLEVARGISFLHGQQPPFTHQNLTSNNVMVNEYWSAKVSDPGLSNILKEGGEYRLSYLKRWSAPEVLLGNRYTTKADVFVRIPAFLSSRS